MAVPTGRPILNVALDEDTRAALLAFCDEQGVTGSALIEAFARCVTEKEEWLEPLVLEARLIAAERRRRNT